MAQQVTEVLKDVTELHIDVIGLMVVLIKVVKYCQKKFFEINKSIDNRYIIN